MRSVILHICMLFVLLLFATSGLFAQKTVPEIVLHYQISAKYFNGTDSVKLGADEASYNVYIKDHQSRTDFINQLGTESAIYDHTSGVGAVFKNYGSQRLLYNLNKAQWEQNIASFFLLQFKIEDQEVVINNMKCKHAVSRLKDNKSVEVYYNPDILLANNSYGLSFQQLNGLPVCIIRVSGRERSAYTLKSISYEPTATTIYDIPQSGYRVMDYEKVKKLEKD